MNEDDKIDIDSQPRPESYVRSGDDEKETPQPNDRNTILVQDQLEKDGNTKRKQRFEVKKWTAVAFWSWDIVVETCAICRNHLMEPCIECQPNSINNSADNCIAAWGVCNHAFHMHCIQRWLKSRAVCPLDNKDWTYQKFGS
ncbi:hypothetical protein CJJ07_004781 [Candidozyma auris]|nr:hypothetical protein CJJ07_004781 [[Candida] auris]